MVNNKIVFGPKWLNTSWYGLHFAWWLVSWWVHTSPMTNLHLWSCVVVKRRKGQTNLGMVSGFALTSRHHPAFQRSAVCRCRPDVDLVGSDIFQFDWTVQSLNVTSVTWDVNRLNQTFCSLAGMTQPRWIHEWCARRGLKPSTPSSQGSSTVPRCKEDSTWYDKLTRARREVWSLNDAEKVVIPFWLSDHKDLGSVDVSNRRA